MADWAARRHVSTKTLQRDIEREFDASFTALRTRIRLKAAAALLHGHSVTETAHLVGYSSASSFVAAFTREFGETPGRFPQHLAASCVPRLQSSCPPGPWDDRGGPLPGRTAGAPGKAR